MNIAEIILAMLTILCITTIILYYIYAKYDDKNK